MKSEVDDWLSELPPLDGADDEPTADDDAADDLPAGLEGDASLDDTNADDLEIDEGLDSTEHEAPASDDDETWQADVGEAELDLDDDEDGDSLDGEAPGWSESDADLDDDLPATDDDAGEEGTTDAIEQSIDEELPALDADDEGDFEDALMLEPGFGAPERATVDWAEAPWVRGGDARAFLFAPSEVDPVVRMALCVARGRLVSVAVAARLHVETTDGAPRTTEVASPFAGDERPLVALGARNGAMIIWAATRAGELAKSDDLGLTWSRCANTGCPLFAITTNDDGSLVALSGDDAGFHLAVSADGTRFETRGVAFDSVSPPTFDRRVWLAARGGAVALGDAGGVLVSRDGQRFQRVGRAVGATAGVFAGEGSAAPLVLSSSPRSGDDGARLLRVTVDNQVEIVADLTADEDDDEHHDASVVLSLFWTDADQRLWIATGARLIAFSNPTAKPSPSIA